MTSNTLPFVPPPPTTTWTPHAPPSLEGVSTVALDLETTGLQWWEDDRPIGISVTSKRGTSYLPFGHKGGGNLDEAVVKEWARRELRGKHLIGLNLKFDLHFMRTWGINLEEQGCSVGDVAHSAALLDDSRTKFSLDRLCQDFLGQEKVGKHLDVTRMEDYHSSEVAPRAEADTAQVWQLEQMLNPRLDAENLQHVKLLENQVLWVVCEMEKNGCPIDEERLEVWLHESEQEYLRLLWNIYRDTNLNVNVQSTKSLLELCHTLHLPIIETPEGRPSFTDDILATYPHPVIDKVRRARKLASLRSKYLVKYRNAICHDGLLRYSLHQLRSDDYGTVSGRFSSSALTRYVGINIQQVPSCEKQQHALGDAYLIRHLHRPSKGQWLCADASQIEYRIFADMAQNPTVLAAYADNPSMSFHHVVWKQLQALQPSILYKDAKTLSFAKLYGGGTARIASMLGLITAEQYHTLRRTNASADHPWLQQAQSVVKVYDQALPEVRAMLQHATADAHRHGYVTTALGRRARLTRPHAYKALNRKIQGTAADVLKLKLVELHRQRTTTGFLLRFTVHDEVDGDCPDTHCQTAVQTLLNDQALPTTVPLLWDVHVGQTWGACD